MIWKIIIVVTLLIAVWAACGVYHNTKTLELMLKIDQNLLDAILSEHDKQVGTKPVDELKELR